MIKLQEVWKTYLLGEHKVEALRSIDLEIKKGDFLAILGPSGSGKSTLMNLIGLLDTPTEGKVLLEDKDASKINENEAAKLRGKKIGFVFQTFNLIPSLTALENVALPLIFQGVADRERNERATALLKEVGLAKRIHHLPSQLSGGEQQRVAIARALVNNPDIMLADEPTGNLDSKTSLEILHLLKQLNKKGKTVVLITHNKALTKFADKTLHIIDGRIRK